MILRPLVLCNLHSFPEVWVLQVSVWQYFCLSAPRWHFLFPPKWHWFAQKIARAANSIIFCTCASNYFCLNGNVLLLSMRNHHLLVFFVGLLFSGGVVVCFLFFCPQKTLFPMFARAACNVSLIRIRRSHQEWASRLCGYINTRNHPDPGNFLCPFVWLRPLTLDKEAGEGIRIPPSILNS